VNRGKGRVEDGDVCGPQLGQHSQGSGVRQTEVVDQMTLRDVELKVLVLLLLDSGSSVDDVRGIGGILGGIDLDIATPSPCTTRLFSAEMRSCSM